MKYQEMIKSCSTGERHAVICRNNLRIMHELSQVMSLLPISAGFSMSCSKKEIQHRSGGKIVFIVEEQGEEGLRGIDWKSIHRMD